MGYESRIYIVNKSTNTKNEEGRVFADVIAKFNLSKMESSFSGLFKKGDTECYIYDGDGENTVGNDNYGQYLQEGDLDEVKDWLKNEIVIKKEKYRRLRPFYNFLKGLRKNQWENLVILHYGY